MTIDSVFCHRTVQHLAWKYTNAGITKQGSKKNSNSVSVISYVWRCTCCLVVWIRAPPHSPRTQTRPARSDPCAEHKPDAAYDHSTYTPPACNHEHAYCLIMNYSSQTWNMLTTDQTVPGMLYVWNSFKSINRRSLIDLQTDTHIQTFNDPLSKTTQVCWYQKKHSPTHTHEDEEERSAQNIRSIA